MNNKKLRQFAWFGLFFINQVLFFAPAAVYAQGTATGNNPFGNIINPLPGGGLIPLLSNVLRLIFVIAGIFSFIRIVLAGLAFVGAGGDPKKIEQAWSSIWQSLMGLVIIVASFAIAAIAGLILFGKWDAILNPQIYGPGNPANPTNYMPGVY